MANGTTRFKCNGCVNRLTSNQLRKHNGVCMYCKTPMHHDNWRPVFKKMISDLDLSDDQRDLILRISNELEIHPNELFRAAVVNKLMSWSSDSSGELKAVKKDLMLAKLVKV